LQDVPASASGDVRQANWIAVNDSHGPASKHVAPLPSSTISSSPYSLPPLFDASGFMETAPSDSTALSITLRDAIEQSGGPV
jgi:hypothetical protein